MASPSPGVLNYAAPDPVSRREAISACFCRVLGWTLDALVPFLVVISMPKIAADFHVETKAIARFTFPDAGVQACLRIHFDSWPIVTGGSCP